MTLGCSIVCIFPGLYNLDCIAICFTIFLLVLLTLPSGALTLLIMGGAAYVIGIFFFILGNTKPIFHVVWHCFVMIAAALHWFDVYFFIVAMRIGDEVNDVPANSN